MIEFYVFFQFLYCLPIINIEGWHMLSVFQNLKNIFIKAIILLDENNKLALI